MSEGRLNIADLSAGDAVMRNPQWALEGHKECLGKKPMTVHSGLAGLYVECRDGRHLLDKEADVHGWLPAFVRP